MPKTTRCGGILGFVNKGGRKGEKVERRLNGYAVSGFIASPFLGLAYAELKVNFVEGCAV